MNGYYVQVTAVLKKHGFSFSRQKGSHQTWTNGRRSVTVSTTCDSRYTANAIMKQAGINHHF
ncbi:putative RNA binding protein YcfA (HicA-like mRNA interferase family) [Pseudacidovorax sp. 1753]|uniref:type II toxin-antitoxin system HicA family toxin n=1 Tax=Pseudacidovorax sp. 1753 TaxID=3156419 RepID=UPI0033955A7C